MPPGVKSVPARRSPLRLSLSAPENQCCRPRASPPIRCRGPAPRKSAAPSVEVAGGGRTRGGVSTAAIEWIALHTHSAIVSGIRGGRVRQIPTVQDQDAHRRSEVHRSRGPPPKCGLCASTRIMFRLLCRSTFKKVVAWLISLSFQILPRIEGPPLRLLYWCRGLPASGTEPFPLTRSLPSLQEKHRTAPGTACKRRQGISAPQF